MIYPATPYSHPNPEVREMRFLTVNAIAAIMMAKGRMVYSPISQSHPIALAGDLPVSWEYWEAYDRKILSICSEVLVACQPGWKDSVGLAAEVGLARELGLTVRYITEFDAQRMALQIVDNIEGGHYA